jgi:hypothetical protein
MVLAPRAEHDTFSDSALVIASSTSRGPLDLRIPLGDGLPSARLAVSAHRSERTLMAKGLVVRVPRLADADWEERASRRRDTVRVEALASGHTWRLGVEHRIDDALIVGGQLVVVGEGDRGTQCSLPQLDPSPTLAHHLQARAAVVQHPGQTILATHRLESPRGAAYRLACTITDPFDIEDPDRHQPLNAVQVVEVERGRLRALGIIRASADTFDEDAMLTALEDRQGKTQVRIDGDQIVALFGDEFVLARVVERRLVEQARLRLLSSKPSPRH